MVVMRPRRLGQLLHTRKVGALWRFTSVAYVKLRCLKSGLFSSAFSHVRRQQPDGAEAPSRSKIQTIPFVDTSYSGCQMKFCKKCPGLLSWELVVSTPCPVCRVRIWKWRSVADKRCAIQKKPWTVGRQREIWIYFCRCRLKQFIWKFANTIRFAFINTIHV
jgi:hypothetical protein